ncbi:hypothetical protein DY000_02048435 [Brassica cretica]|uniref:Uncharacterized protein n=1 Tax=Brassica cretica TaxID=69181 RepID=A0ABQ7ETU6_BRACR|nr:hypothetical protein DY000_02048435 [Brassica cretica]
MSATLWLNLNYSSKPELIGMFGTGDASTEPVTSRWLLRRLSLFHAVVTVCFFHITRPQGHYCLLPSPPQSRYHKRSDVFKSHNGFVTSSTTKLLCLVHLPVTRTNSKYGERAREIERERSDQCGDKR